MKKIKKCERCGKEFEGGQNAEYCLECKPINKREKERLWAGKRKGSPVAEGKWRCPICGAFKDRHAAKCVVCQGNLHRGENNVNWRGGITRTRGYVFIRQGAGFNAKYVQEHRLVWEQNHGKMPEGYIIHHLNGIKDDNRLANLAALPNSAHSGSAVLNIFKARIRQLEAQLREFQGSNKLI